MFLYSCCVFASNVYRQLKLYIPFKLLVFLFILWANSSYVPAIKNVGFYCDDESIKRPFTGDSINFLCLMTVLLGIFPLIIYLTEIILNRNEESSQKYPLRLLLRKYYSGFLFLLAFTEVIKLYVCELRPHFLTTCKPDMSTIRCSDGYITQFNCTGKPFSTLLGRDIYKSFPSGHASLSVFSFLFCNIYLFSRVRTTRTSTNSLWRWWSYIIPVITFLWTVTCCMSRILDNRHFWWDVLVGIILGIVGGFITIKRALKTVLRNTKISNIPKDD